MDREVMVFQVFVVLLQTCGMQSDPDTAAKKAVEIVDVLVPRSGAPE